MGRYSLNRMVKNTLRTIPTKPTVIVLINEPNVHGG
jgi:hypothetical protein